MSSITARSPVSAEVVLCSLRGLVLVKKDGPSVGISNSYQVLGSNSWSNAWFSPSVGRSVGRRLIGVRSCQQVIFLQVYQRRAYRFMAVQYKRKVSIIGISVKLIS